MDNQQGPTVWHMELCLTLCGSLHCRWILHCWAPGKATLYHTWFEIHLYIMTRFENQPWFYTNRVHGTCTVPILGGGVSGRTDTCICMAESLHYSPETITTLLVGYDESEVAQSCTTLCDPLDCNLSGSSVHGIFQARVLEWVAISFSRGSSQPRDQTQVSHIAGRRFTLWATRGSPLLVGYIPIQNKKFCFFLKEQEKVY